MVLSYYLDLDDIFENFVYGLEAAIIWCLESYILLWMFYPVLFASVRFLVDMISD
jgi:hypothetical protein